MAATQPAGREPARIDHPAEIGDRVSEIHAAPGRRVEPSHSAGEIRDELARSMHQNGTMIADTFIAHVADHAGVSIERAERVTCVVLSGFGSYLLSSSTGMTQERRHETFAEGQPGYERSLGGWRRE